MHHTDHKTHTPRSYTPALTDAGMPSFACIAAACSASCCRILAILPSRPPNRPARPLVSLANCCANLISAADADAAVPSLLRTMPHASAKRALCSSSDSELSESDPACDSSLPLLLLLSLLLLLLLLGFFRRFFLLSALLRD